MTKASLEVKNLSVSYGAVKAVRSVSFTAAPGAITAFVGANGAGKTSILRAISGLLPVQGRVTLRTDSSTEDLTTLKPELIAQRGVVHVPEGRGIFPNLTVLENLKLATWGKKDKIANQKNFKKAFSLFPRLAERIAQSAGTLSGGEQQMLAIGRAIVAQPKILLLDEPSMGLAPVLVREIFSVVTEINQAGTTILLVEQNANMALHLAHMAFVLETGEIVKSGKGRDLLNDPLVRKAYLGS